MKMGVREADDGGECWDGWIDELMNDDMQMICRVYITYLVLYYLYQ